MTDIVYATTALPDAYHGIPYEGNITAKGNATVITAASVSSGSLPPGLSVVGGNPADARITGTVSGVRAVLPKTFTFKVTLTDTAGAVQSGNYTITVREPQAAAAAQGGYQALPPVAQQAAMWPTQF